MNEGHPRTGRCDRRGRRGRSAQFRGRTLRDTAVQADHGRVRKAKRVNGSSAEWKITVAPSSDEAVTVTLSPGNGACGEPGVICTADGRKLSNYAAWVAPGPSSNTVPTELGTVSGLPTIAGTARVGETLEASVSEIADADGLDNAVFAYQWVSNYGNADADIAGATATEYTLTAAQVGKTVKVRVTFTDDGGTEETLVSAATGTVEPVARAAAVNTPATGLPAITGTARVGETLRASVSGIADADGLSETPRQPGKAAKTAPTTQPGYRNRNDQVVVRRTPLPGTDHNQRVYVLECGRCRHWYGANGSDIWQRRCPSCGGGRPGLNFD